MWAHSDSQISCFTSTVAPAELD